MDVNRDITLKSKDEQTIKIKITAAKMAGFIDVMLKNADESGIGEDDVYPVPEINGDVLREVVAYCEQHHNNAPDEIPKPLRTDSLKEMVSEWDFRFMTKQADSNEKLFELLQAANYLDIKPLLDLVCAHVACNLKGKSPEEIRDKFGIVNDFTTEEELQIKEENKWCEDA